MCDCSVFVGREALDFTAPAVLGNGEISENFQFRSYVEGSYALLFFYPLDFTFVCPSELIALDKRYSEFVDRSIKIIAVSVDSQFCHLAWRNTPIESGGVGRLKFPMVADVNHSIAMDYGVEHPSQYVALRGAFLLDRKFIVRSQIVNDMPLGRDIDEILRVFDAWSFHEQHGEVCPANWREGRPGMRPSKEGVATFLKENFENL